MPVTYRVHDCRALEENGLRFDGWVVIDVEDGKLSLGVCISRKAFDILDVIGDFSYPSPLVKIVVGLHAGGRV